MKRGCKLEYGNRSASPARRGFEAAQVGQDDTDGELLLQYHDVFGKSGTLDLFQCWESILNGVFESNNALWYQAKPIVVTIAIRHEASHVGAQTNYR